MGVGAEEPEMKVLLALTFLLAFLALGLSEPDTDRDVELLSQHLELREKREPAKGDNKGGKNKRIKKKNTKTKGKGKNVENKDNVKKIKNSRKKTFRKRTKTKAR